MIPAQDQSGSGLQSSGALLTLYGVAAPGLSSDFKITRADICQIGERGRLAEVYNMQKWESRAAGLRGRSLPAPCI